MEPLKHPYVCVPESLTCMKSRQSWMRAVSNLTKCMRPATHSSNTIEQCEQGLKYIQAVSPPHPTTKHTQCAPSPLLPKVSGSPTPAPILICSNTTCPDVNLTNPESIRHGTEFTPILTSFAVVVPLHVAPCYPLLPSI
jgi:hypothetical protein